MLKTPNAGAFDSHFQQDIVVLLPSVRIEQLDHSIVCEFHAGQQLNLTACRVCRAGDGNGHSPESSVPTITSGKNVATIWTHRDGMNMPVVTQGWT
jgi:hypothetical protein